ncbi:MAG: AMP-binding protein, partial [Pseudomonadota bacterium]
FGPEALLHRLNVAGAVAFIGDLTGTSRLSEIIDALPDLKHVVAVDASVEKAMQFEELLTNASAKFPVANTSPDDPAMMLFTSGTTGQPKGALHGHRVLLGHLPGIQMAQGFMPQDGDKFWTPSDWAWAGGLLNALLPALYFGVTVIAARAPKFDPDWAVNLIKKAGIRNVFMPATAIKLMQSALENSVSLNLRTMGTAGEALGAQTLLWAKTNLGLKINEFYGQTECNAIISACHELDVFKAGSMGKQVPGHEVAIIDANGNALEADQVGEIAIRQPNPVMFLEYWNDFHATKDKFIGDWMLTGDRGSRNEDGYFHFLGRNDDVITSAGYRIGPSEIEDCLTAHPAVELAAVVGKADPVRTEIVTANIMLAEGYKESRDLEVEIRNYVKSRLSAHEYPRAINFVGNVPLTESGKVIRRHFRE